MKRALIVSALLMFVTMHDLPARQGQPKVVMMQVTGPIYMLSGGGGNIGVVADPTGLLMIDAMEEAEAPQIRDLLKKLPGGDHVKILINTHWHGDHTGGNRVFGSGAAIIAHENVRATVSKDQTILGSVSKALPHPRPSPGPGRIIMEFCDS
jgi:glyoxylase-like metal-dependent hydrolase (beta-lactamase superfamily II)